MTSHFLEIDGISKIYPTAKGSYTVLEDVNLTIDEGEFICLIGHSGCGKSTLLNMVAGLNKPTEGQILLKNQRITEPGPDRMVIFQNYSLLPWKTAYENVYLAVEQVYKHRSAQEKKRHYTRTFRVGRTDRSHQQKAFSTLGWNETAELPIARALANSP